MLLTLGGIDKTSHMWGGITDDGAAAGRREQAHLPFIARTRRPAGRPDRRSACASCGQLDETLIVLTTDHAGQPSRRFHGVDGAGRGDFNWYYGATQNGTYLQPSPALAAADRHRQRPLHLPGLGGPHVADRHLGGEASGSAAKVMATLPDVIASYRLDRSERRYRLVTREPARDEPRRVRQLGCGTARSSSTRWPRRTRPDVVGLLKDDASYGAAGDHGGHQKAVQDIPIVFAGAGVGSRDSRASAALGRHPARRSCARCGSRRAGGWTGGR